MSLLKALNNAGALRALDHALAQSLRRLDPDTPDAVLAAAALASLAVSQGHAGFDPRQPQRLVDMGVEWPDPAQWSAQLAASPWIVSTADAREASAQSLLVWENGLLYLRRYREYERRLALGLQRIGGVRPPLAALGGVAALFTRLFPGEVLPLVATQGDLFGGAQTAGDALLPQAGEGARRADEGSFCSTCFESALTPTLSRFAGEGARSGHHVHLQHHALSSP